MHDNSAQWMQDFETTESSSRHEAPLTHNGTQEFGCEATVLMLAVCLDNETSESRTVIDKRKGRTMSKSFAEQRYQSRTGRLGKGRGLAQIVCSKQRWLEPLGCRERQLLQNEASCNTVVFTTPGGPTIKVLSLGCCWVAGSLLGASAA